MDRATRDKFASGTDQSDVTTGNACWETAPEVFAKLNDDFGPFDVDICADAGRKLCPVFFGPGSSVGEPDAMKCDWHRHGTNGFDNPPYGRFVQAILLKAKNESRRGFSSTHLLPMRVTMAFKNNVLGGHARIGGASELLFCDSRLVFHENGQPRWNKKHLAEGRYVGDSAMFDSIVVRFEAGYVGPLRVGLWKVPEHGKWKPKYELEDPNTPDSADRDPLRL